jgi:hypothetical protein
MLNVRVAMRDALRSRALLSFGAVLAVGALLRVVFLYGWRPALMGFPDSSVYLTDVALDPFANASRPAGYGRFLAAVHALSAHLAMVSVVQHALGLATAVVLWVAMRRLGASAWIALVPAAAVALGGAQLFLEHAVMSETAFTFCVVVGLAATVEAARTDRVAATVAWSALAALALAAASTLRLPALFLLPVFAAWILLSRGRPRRGQLAATVAFAAVALASVLGFMAWYDHGTGHFAFTRTGFYNSYARVATFADCSKFTPPTGTEKLCPRVPLEQRKGHEWWIFSGESPLVVNYGVSFGGNPPPQAAGEVSRFVRASILGQPGAYLAQVGRDAWRVIDPGSASTVGQGNDSAGYGEQEMIDAFNDANWQGNALFIAGARSGNYYKPPPGITDHGLIGFFRGYERVVRFTGPLMVLTLLLALGAPWLAPRTLRRPALLLLVTGLVLLITPILSTMYDARYVVPSLPALVGAAALGGAGVAARITHRSRRRAPAAVSG